MAEFADEQRKTLPRQAAQRHARMPLSAQAHALPATPALQRAARQLSSGKGVAQRSVLHKYADDEETIVYYSDLETGKPSYATREKAAEKDAELAADPKNIRHALYKDKKGTPRRAPTPYSYANTVPLTAAANSRRQGPHTVGFASTEYRLQQRLEHGQQAELESQIPAPDAFDELLTEIGPSADVTGKAAHRMRLDYRSLYAEYEGLLVDAAAPKDVGSRFHLVARKLMQMHPATTYGKNIKSAGKGERSKSRFGAHVLDAEALRYGDREKLEAYYNLREDLFHSTDDETDREDFSPFDYTTITPATKEDRRDRRVRRGGHPTKSVLGGIDHPKPFHADGEEAEGEPAIKKFKADTVVDDGGGGGGDAHDDEAEEEV